MKVLNNTISNIQHDQDELNKKMKALKKCKDAEKEKLKKRLYLEAN